MWGKGSVNISPIVYKHTNTDGHRDRHKADRRKNRERQADRQKHRENEPDMKTHIKQNAIKQKDSLQKQRKTDSEFYTVSRFI